MAALQALFRVKTAQLVRTPATGAHRREVLEDVEAPFGWTLVQIMTTVIVQMAHPDQIGLGLMVVIIGYEPTLACPTFGTFIGGLHGGLKS